MECDIAVIGAGPAGLSFARLLAGSGLSVTLVERAPEAAIADPAFDGREIALTHRSQDILQEIEAWDRIPANEMAPLRHARVQDGASPFVLDFSPPGETPLGMLVPNHLIRRALHEAVRESGCATLLAGVAVTSVRGRDVGRDLAAPWQADARRWAGDPREAGGRRRHPHVGGAAPDGYRDADARLRQVHAGGARRA